MTAAGPAPAPPRAAALRPPIRRRISPEMTAGLLSVVVLVLAGIVAGPSLASGIGGGSAGTTPSATSTPVALASGAPVSLSPSAVPATEPGQQPTGEPTSEPTPSPSPSSTPGPTPEPTPTPTPTLAPTPSPTASPVNPQVTLVISMNGRLDNIAVELTDAAEVPNPDVSVIANDLSRVVAAISVAADAVKRFPPELAPVGTAMLAGYKVITDDIAATLATSQANTAVYVRGARSAAAAIAKLGPITQRLAAAAGVP